MQRRYMEVDVFTEAPYCGNPLAVVVDGDGLSDAVMQRFANWTNLSETTFLCNPTDPAADYAVRIFTANEELPFAGHPTLGSCHVWLASGGRPKSDAHVVQQCAAGLITVGRGDGQLEFAAPPLLRDGPLASELVDRVAADLGIRRDDIVDCAWVDNGPGWIGVLLESADRVLSLRPTLSDLKIGVIGAHLGGPFAYEVRGFFPNGAGGAEDPVTGSLNASLAQWLIGAGVATPPYRVRQGTVLGRAGDVRIRVDAAAQVWVGGAVVPCVEGTVLV
jgi:PhzF family phenazine biosynthesis protein